MKKQILTFLTLALISGLANAGYIVKVPLETSNGGTLPNNSISIGSGSGSENNEEDGEIVSIARYIDTINYGTNEGYVFYDNPSRGMNDSYIYVVGNSISLCISSRQPLNLSGAKFIRINGVETSTSNYTEQIYNPQTTIGEDTYNWSCVYYAGVNIPNFGEPAITLDVEILK
ncbi:TPA: hypothetical protein NHK58_001417 [Pseudomonas aeruginosa]|nr:hypothetical protein [Pseudomonas aeruginosa]